MIKVSKAHFSKTGRDDFLKLFSLTQIDLQVYIIVCTVYTIIAVSITTKKQSEVTRPICNTTLKDMFLCKMERCVLASFIYTFQMILSCTIQTVEWDPEGILYEQFENFSPNSL